jgi:hypothetical protein
MARSFEDIQAQAQQELREAAEELIATWLERAESCKERAEDAKRYSGLAQYCQKMAQEIQRAVAAGNYAAISEENKADYGWKWSRNYDGNSCDVE